MIRKSKKYLVYTRKLLRLDFFFINSKPEGKCQVSCVKVIEWLIVVKKGANTLYFIFSNMMLNVVLNLALNLDLVATK